MDIPKNHPRYESLLLREKIKDCLKEGVLSEVGIAAHGRGEAFDYLLGEKTTEEADKAIKAAAIMICKAETPVISVNGNIACLVPGEIVQLSKIVPLKIEINLFYRTYEREIKIKKRLEKYGATTILGIGENANESIPGLDSLRGKVSEEGIFNSDVVIVPLEDGDRALALKKMGKKIIAIDLNPFSRTSLCSDITIVDNVVRAMPKLIEEIKKFKDKRIEECIEFDNSENIRKSIEIMKNNLIHWEEKINER
ncbi:MAG: 4-phosphopantoate--beta-alanine ligase [Candidatus Methanofastidiosum methylothiophilum]|uniref:4-phosphopantoate--beta-alanine ligase n=1 Tax=Candidatus Methanofastidiosum methylothiophilum TaxID=1705564 RepID=A0A150J7U7_9EURY|nr:MAG: 4-phosphopantoate--beta-alanine ligase [Candidatus Methanofastidiosum methylthiophilus]